MWFDASINNARANYMILTKVTLVKAKVTLATIFFNCSWLLTDIFIKIYLKICVQKTVFCNQLTKLTVLLKHRSEVAPRCYKQNNPLASPVWEVEVSYNCNQPHKNTFYSFYHDNFTSWNCLSREFKIKLLNHWNIRVDTCLQKKEEF